MSLNIWDANWGLEYDLCPCDVHFCEWLEAQNIKKKRIFHFGTGGHHVLGTHNVEKKLNNAIWGITAAPKEYDEYVKLIIAQPAVGWAYKVFFGDIYQMDARHFPAFDVVTLFHTGEFWSEKNAAYGGLTDLTMSRLLVKKTRKGGHIVFYEGSNGWKNTLPVIAQLEKEGLIKAAGKFKTLPIYQRV